MNNPSKIRIAIVDDNQDCIHLLIEKLSDFSDIEVCGAETRFKPALELLLNKKPDLVFLDIEMPGKNGFRLLNEAREQGATFCVIFFTAYNKYIIQALREAALDYILKPIDPNELKNSIERYKVIRECRAATNLMPHQCGLIPRPETILFPTLTGLQSLDKSSILLFRSTCGSVFHPPCWEVLLTDLSIIQLSPFLSAKKICNILSSSDFFQINQSCIVHLKFLHMVRHANRSCELIPPYDQIKLTVSRLQMIRMKELFEVF